MSYYCSLADARLQLSVGGGTINATEDAKLLRAIWDVSRRIDLELGGDYPVFAPYLGTWEVLVTPDRVNSYNNTLDLGIAFQSISTLSLSGTTLTLGTDIKGYPSTSAPYSVLRMTGYTYSWWNKVCLDCDDDPLTLSITGVRAFRRRSGSSWLKVDDLTADITSSVTSFTVADIDGNDPRGFAPRLSAGNLVRLESEYANILTTTIATNIATLERGVNGSTAAAHVSGTDVEVWQVEDNIRRVTARQAAAIYARIGSYEEKTISEIGLVSYPKDLLMELRAVLQGYAYELP